MTVGRWANAPPGGPSRCMSVDLRSPFFCADLWREQGRPFDFVACTCEFLLLDLEHEVTIGHCKQQAMYARKRVDDGQWWCIMCRLCIVDYLEGWSVLVAFWARNGEC